MVCVPARLTLRAGSTVQLQAQANDAAGRPVPGAPIEFQGGEDGLVSVTSTGLVTAPGRLGTTQLVVQSGAARVEVPVAVAPGDPARIEVAPDGARGAPAGEALPSLVRLRVLDRLGNPVPQATVEFQLGAGGGTIEPAPAKTNGDGSALLRWTLGPTAGPQRVSATTGESGRVQASFDATAFAGPAARLELRSARLPAGPAGSTLDVAAMVLDAHGNGIVRAPVAFRVVRGGGAAAPPAAFAAEDGRAAARWTLGTRPGANELVATCALLPGRSLSIATQATPGAPARIVAVEAPRVQARAGVSVAPTPDFRVEDALGNPVPGVPVRFRVLEGPGRVDPELAGSDELGSARPARWVACAAGPAALGAEVEGLPPAIVRVVVRPDRPGSAARADSGTCR